jgi:predicted nucleic acid-binding protein
MSGMSIDLVVDTNIFILLFNNRLDEAIPGGNLGYSVITEIELLSFATLSQTDEQLIRSHLDLLYRLPLEQEVSEKTIWLRRQHRLKIPDAIVAASAWAINAVLLTNDKQLLAVDTIKTRALRVKKNYGVK